MWPLQVGAHPGIGPSKPIPKDMHLTHVCNPFQLAQETCISPNSTLDCTLIILNMRGWVQKANSGTYIGNRFCNKRQNWFLYFAQWDNTGGRTARLQLVQRRKEKRQESKQDGWHISDDSLPKIDFTHAFMAVSCWETKRGLPSMMHNDNSRSWHLWLRI